MRKRCHPLKALLFVTSWSLSSAFAALRGPLDTIVVAGAGPASLIFAYKYLLLNRFARVRIVEKSPRPRRRGDQEQDDDDDPFGFFLGGRARAILSSIPDLLQKVKSISAFTRAELWIVNRNELCAEILEALDADFEGRLDFFFDTEVIALYEDFTIDTIDKDGEFHCLPYNLLVAADGARSIIRNTLIARNELKCKRYLRPVAWKMLALPEQPNLVPGTFLPYPKMRNEFGAILPRHDGKFVLHSFWRRGGRRSQVNPWNAKSPEDLRGSIQRVFPNVTEFHSDDYLRSFLDERPGSETFMKLDRHAVERLRIALVGDAAVGMYSLMGQGCAHALEGAERLAKKLAENNNVPEALKAYSDESVVQGHAITDINLLAHLQNKRGLKRVIVDIPGITTKLNDPGQTYDEIRREYKWKIRLSRLFWRIERLPMSG